MLDDDYGGTFSGPTPPALLRLGQGRENRVTGDECSGLISA